MLLPLCAGVALWIWYRFYVVFFVCVYVVLIGFCYHLDCRGATVVPTKSDSDVILCFELQSNTLTCALHLS